MAISDLTATTPSAAIKGPTCTVCQQIASLPDVEAEALVALLSNPTWRYQELSDALDAEGINLAPNSLSRHARGRCAARVKLRGAGA